MNSIVPRTLRSGGGGTLSVRCLQSLQRTAAPGLYYSTTTTTPTTPTSTSTTSIPRLQYRISFRPPPPPQPLVQSRQHRCFTTTYLTSSQSQPPSSSNSASEPEDLPIKSYTYTDIKSLSASPNPKIILVDVREPSEYDAGHIPTAKNLPIMSRPDGLFLSKDEFKDAFGWDKPDVAVEGEGAEQGVEVVFYCKAGIRSRAAARLAWEGGWRGVGEYPGSWLDWAEKEGGGKSG